MILILTTPRTGSTWFCEYLSKQHSLENLDEYFGDHDITLEEQVEKLEYIKENTNVVLKCFPWHLKNSRTNFPRSSFLEKNLLKLADKIYVLIRSDFDAQCKSYYLAKSTGIWSGIPQDHVVINVNNNLYNYSVSHLQDGYMQLADYYKKLNCEIAVYETLLFDKKEKYLRPVTWVPEPKHIQFDVNSLFYPKC